MTVTGYSLVLGTLAEDTSEHGVRVPTVRTPWGEAQLSWLGFSKRCGTSDFRTVCVRSVLASAPRGVLLVLLVDSG